MNDTLFFNSFYFVEYKLHHYKHNDATSGTTAHYLGYLKSGHGLLISEHEKIEVFPGDLFFIPCGCRYHSYWDSENIICFDSFGFKYIPVADKKYCLQKIPYDHAAKDILLRLSSEKTVNPTSIGLLYSLFAMLEPHMNIESSIHKNSIVDKAIKYMNENPQTQMSNIAKNCGISETNLYLLFKKTLQKTPNTVRQEILCEHAIELLATTNLTIEEISCRLGFSSSSYFRKVFFSTVGKTPREVRKKSHFI